MRLAVSPLEGWIDRVVADPLCWEEAAGELSRDPALRRAIEAHTQCLDGDSPCADDRPPRGFIAATLAYRVARRADWLAGLAALSHRLQGASGELDRRLHEIVIQVADDLQSLIHRASPDDQAFFWTKLGTARMQAPFGARSVHQEAALQCFDRALAVLPHAPDSIFAKSELYLNLGVLYKERLIGENESNWREAHRSYLESGRFLEEAIARNAVDGQSADDVRRQLAANFGNLWRDAPAESFEQKEQNLMMAVGCYERALSNDHDARRRAQTLRSLAEAQRRQSDRGAWRDAVNCLRQSMQILQKLPPSEGLAMTLLLLGTTLHQVEQEDGRRYDEAREHMGAAERLFEALGLHRLRIYALYNLGLLEWSAGRWKFALGSLEESAGLVEKLFPQRSATDDDRNAWLALHTQVYETLLAVIVRCASEAPPPESEALAARAAEWAELARARNLAEWLQQDSPQNPSCLKAPQLASLAIGAEACLLTLRMTPFGAVAIAVAPSGRFLCKLFEALTAGVLREIWLEWGKAYHQYVNRSPRTDPAVTLAAVETWNAQIEAATGRLGQSLGQPLHDFLRECFATEPASPQPQTVVVFPGQGFNLLPLHAMTWEQNGRQIFADDEYFYTVAPGARILAERQAGAQRSDSAQTPLLISNPTADVGLRPFEAFAIDSRNCGPSARVLGAYGPPLGTLASRQQLLAGNHGRGEISSASRVLFATHGHCDFRDPWKHSFLELARTGKDHERLTLEDLVEARLSGVELVVLCACESGIPDPNDSTGEQLGLPTGLLYAGVRGVVGTLWEVLGVPAAVLCFHYFKQMQAGDGDCRQWRMARQFQTARTWLRRATRDEIAAVQTELFGQPRPMPPGDLPYAAPFYWAAFSWYGIG